MTAISGHNVVIQQSGVAQELAHQTAAPKPSPEQAAALREAGEIVKNSTVQEFEESEKLKFKKEKDELTIEQKEEDAKCSICGSGDYEENDLIVFCGF